ncbi:hypothetical protein GQ44DRAFT_713345 [Phaeosphaeriaceae sp. PMI808]|nr:hypothetical protein GQ44DRAFT_713345 [Phaeosphaeriaceae sp. PMI808]
MTRNSDLNYFASWTYWGRMLCFYHRFQCFCCCQTPSKPSERRKSGRKTHCKDQQFFLTIIPAKMIRCETPKTCVMVLVSKASSSPKLIGARR